MLDLTMPVVAYTIGLLQTDGTHQGSLDGKGRVSLELAVRDENVLWQIAAILPCYASVGHRTRTTNFGENQAEAARILGRTASSVSLRTWRLRNAMSRRAAP